MLKFAFQHYEVRGIIKREPNEQLGYCVTLGSSWIPPRDASGHILLEGPLYQFSETIALSRNRPLRHGVTNVLNNRILGLTASVAATYKL
jgi:hypothetical protein